MLLNIAYISSRKENLYWWFINSLRRQIKPGLVPRIIVVDFWAQEMPLLNWGRAQVRSRLMAVKAMTPDFELVHVPPKPTPWQGPYRLTSKDYFAASNARNTAILYAQDGKEPGYIAYVDDLSVLMPTWFGAVKEACEANRVTAGAFTKHKKIVVNSSTGLVESFEPFPPGKDSRWNGGNDKHAVEVPPNQLFGCSVVAPIQRFLDINGWPEEADSTGIGMEDCHTGIALFNSGHRLYYDRRMLTYESEEHHGQGPVMLRLDKKKDGVTVRVGNGTNHTHPHEKGHFFVQRHKNTKRFENYFGPEGISGLRDRVLRGEPIPTTVMPTVDWHDNQPLEQL